MNDDLKQFPSGARSSAQLPRYDLIPRDGDRRTAARFLLGLEKYGEGNYRKGFGDHDWVIDRFNHAQEHLNSLLRKYKANPGVPLEAYADDDLAALAWFVHIMFERDAYLTERANESDAKL